MGEFERLKGALFSARGHYQSDRVTLSVKILQCVTLEKAIVTTTMKLVFKFSHFHFKGWILMAPSISADLTSVEEKPKLCLTFVFSQEPEYQ